MLLLLLHATYRCLWLILAGRVNTTRSDCSLRLAAYVYHNLYTCDWHYIQQYSNLPSHWAR